MELTSGILQKRASMATIFLIVPIKILWTQAAFCPFVQIVPPRAENTSQHQVGITRRRRLPSGWISHGIS